MAPRSPHHDDLFARLAARAATDPAFASRVRTDVVAAARELAGHDVPGSASALEGYALHSNGAWSGPHSAEDLARAIAAGTLHPDSEVFDPASGGWLPVARFLAGDATTASTPPAAPADTQVIVYRNERESVAYTPDGAREAVARGELQPNDWAWDAAKSDWVPLRTIVPGLAPSPPPAAPTAPDPELARLRDDNAVLAQKVESLERHLAQALKSCAAADRVRDELRERDAELAAARTAASRAAAESSRLNQELADLRVKADAAEQNAARSGAEAGKLAVELGTLRPEHDTLRVRAEALDRDLRERTATVEDLRREVAQVRGILAEIAAALARAQPAKPAPLPRLSSRT